MNMAFERSTLELAVKLFMKLFSEKENVLISPVSIAAALAMTANGAEGETKKELEALLGTDISLEEYNELAKAYFTSLPSSEGSKFTFANSIWFPDFLKVRQEFVDKNKEYFDAEVRQLPFDEQAADEINSWVCKKTDGMIDSVLDAATPESLMYLINALAFDGKWEEPFGHGSVQTIEFANADGTTSHVQGMRGTVEKYIQGNGFSGFVKPYEDNRYSFMALLPAKRTGISEFVENLSVEKLLKAFAGASDEEIDIMLPKFTSAYGKELPKVLMELGVKKAFSSEAEFGGISETPSCVGDVIHKTFIEVDEEGTRAGAVTAVMMKLTSLPVQRKEVILDRPFVYAIMDSQKGVPLFLGAVLLLPDAPVTKENIFIGGEETGNDDIITEKVMKPRWWQRIFRKKDRK